MVSILIGILFILGPSKPFRCFNEDKTSYELREYLRFTLLHFQDRGFVRRVFPETTYEAGMHCLLKSSSLFIRIRSVFFEDPFTVGATDLVHGINCWIPHPIRRTPPKALCNDKQ